MSLETKKLKLRCGFGGRGRTNVGRGLALLMRSARLDGCVSSPVRQISAIVWRNRLFGRT